MTTNVKVRRIVSVIRAFDLKTITRNYLENSEEKWHRLAQSRLKLQFPKMRAKVSGIKSEQSVERSE